MSVPAGMRESVAANVRGFATMLAPNGGFTWANSQAGGGAEATVIAPVLNFVAQLAKQIPRLDERWMLFPIMFVVALPFAYGLFWFSQETVQAVMRSIITSAQSTIIAVSQYHGAQQTPLAAVLPPTPPERMYVNNRPTPAPPTPDPVLAANPAAGAPKG